MANNWIKDGLHDFYNTSLRFENVLVDEQSKYQHIQIVRTEFFGNVLLLDGIIQLTELDNAGYHELLVHIPMLAHSQPTRVLIVGGGDGGALHQVLRYNGIDQVVVCELDQRVVDLCSQYFPKFGAPFSDARVDLVVEDAFDFLQRDHGGFDVILADTPDPVGPATRLFSASFYKSMKRALLPKGTVVTQCENMFFDLPLIKRLMDMAKPQFAVCEYYHTLVPTYPGGNIGFLYLSDIPWQNGLGKEYPGLMEYLNPQIHQAAFALPEFFNRTGHDEDGPTIKTT